MAVWEYKVCNPQMKIRDRVEVMEREFNRLGEDGWELCSDHGGRTPSNVLGLARQLDAAGRAVTGRRCVG